jgi:hypothetical protein
MEGPARSSISTNGGIINAIFFIAGLLSFNYKVEYKMLPGLARAKIPTFEKK